MIKFIKSILKLIASLLIIILTPIIFVLIWLSLTQTEWKNILKISEKQLQFLFPNYTITADSIITNNINTTSFGSIYLKVNNSAPIASISAIVITDFTIDGMFILSTPFLTRNNKVSKSSPLLYIAL